MPKKHQIEHAKQCRRLDIFLREVDSRFSRQVAREAVDSGEILVNNRRTKPGYMLQLGDTVEICSEPAAVTARTILAREQGAVVSADVSSSLHPPRVQILFEDEAVIALYKPRGMHSVVIDADDQLTLADCLTGWREEQLFVSPDPREAGLVQRLDRFTEGVILAAKTVDAWQSLHHELVHGQSKKRYVALVEGVFKEKRQIVSGLIDASRRRVAFPAAAGELSESVVTILWQNKDRRISLVEIGLTHAVRHQVRAHLAGIGYPLVGDVQYGAKKGLDLVGFEEAEGFYLLAQSIQFRHPVREDEVLIRCEAQWVEVLMRGA